MGTVWEDEGRVKVLVVRPDVSIGQVEHACDYVQRGDILLPFTERPAPPLKSEANFDRFAPANGKPMAMVITGKKFQQQVGNEDIIYVNLGNAQGVKVGDYFRIFRYQGTQHETDYQTPRYAFDMEFHSAVPDAGIYGFGSVPKKYNWSNVPREDMGEGVVLRTGPNSATVLITFCLREIFRATTSRSSSGASPGLLGRADCPGRKSDSRNTSAVKPWIFVSGSRHASRSSPAFTQVSSRNRPAAQRYSIATCGSSTPRCRPRLTISPCLPASICVRRNLL